jgi:peptidyl-prolyl cis-trans isomerase C
MTHAATGCGGAACGCGGHAAAPPPSVNGVFLLAKGEQVDPDALRERAWSELLRQEAVRRGLLPAHEDLEAPGLSMGDQLVVEGMLDEAADVGAPSEEECRRFYEARQSQYVEGAQVRARHILFAVTAGVDVQKLAARAEQALPPLTH